MVEELLIQRVEVSFVGAPPAQQLERASGVSEVEIDGPILRCFVRGSFQPLLEALRGHEVISLKSTSSLLSNRRPRRHRGNDRRAMETRTETRGSLLDSGSCAIGAPSETAKHRKKGG
jgi:hypothetical protein